MLVLSRKLNQSIMIGDAVEIRIVDIKGDQVKIGIAAPRTVPVYRKEVYDEIRSTNVAAAASSQALTGLGQLFGKKAVPADDEHAAAPGMPDKE